MREIKEREKKKVREIYRKRERERIGFIDRYSESKRGRKLREAKVEIRLIFNRTGVTNTKKDKIE